MRPILVSSDAPAPSTLVSHPPGWHSPVPYLFGGLAAMLGLIAFALLILACSYWKLSGFPPDEDPQDTEAANDDEDDLAAKKAAAAAAWQNNVLVIMAGQVLPTFLATPSTSRTSSFGDPTASNSSALGSCDADKPHKLELQLSDSLPGLTAVELQHHQPLNHHSV